MAEDELRVRTLTNLYNHGPSWLAHADERLDRAVYAAYGCDYPLDPDVLLGRLRAERSSSPLTATAQTVT